MSTWSFRFPPPSFEVLPIISQHPPTFYESSHAALLGRRLASPSTLFSATYGLVKTLPASVSLGVPNRCRASLIDGRFLKLKFPLGQVVATPGALGALQESGEEVTPYLRRHSGGDWGELDEHDLRENQLSLQRGFRLLSAYTLRSGIKIWIITEADRSSTTILLPDEY